MLTPEGAQRVRVLRRAITYHREALATALENLSNCVKACPDVNLADLVRALGPEADRLACLTFAVVLDMLHTGEPELGADGRCDRIVAWAARHAASVDRAQDAREIDVLRMMYGKGPKSE